MTDMTLGRWSHVPALSILSSLIAWQGAKPRTPRTDFVWLPQSANLVAQGFPQDGLL